MPPWQADPHYGKFSNDLSLAPAEKQTLIAWVGDRGALWEGDSCRGLLAARSFYSGLGVSPNPTSSLKTPERFFRSPRKAQSTISNVSVPTAFHTKTSGVRDGAEVRPLQSLRSSSRHRHGGTKIGDGPRARNMSAGYASGHDAPRCGNPGQARLIRAGLVPWFFSDALHHQWHPWEGPHPHRD